MPQPSSPEVSLRPLLLRSRDGAVVVEHVERRQPLGVIHHGRLTLAVHSSIAVRVALARVRVFNVIPLCKESLPKAVVLLVDGEGVGSLLARLGQQSMHVGVVAAGIEALFRDIFCP